MRFVSRIRVRRGSVTAWSDLGGDTLPTTAFMVVVAAGIAEPDTELWKVLLLGFVALCVLLLSLRTACLFAARRGSYLWLPSSLRPWRWRRGGSDRVTVERRPTREAATVLVGEVRGDEVAELRVGDRVLLSRTAVEPCLELGRKIALLLGSELADRTGDQPRVVAPLDVAAESVPRVPSSPDPGAPPEGLRVDAGPVAVLPAGSGPAADNIPRFHGAWAAGLLAVAAFVAWARMTGSPGAVPALYVAFVAVLAALAFGLLMGRAALRRPLRVHVGGDGVRIRAEGQPRWAVRPVPVDRIQAVVSHQGAVFLRLAEADVPVATDKLSARQASWLAAWLAHRIGRFAL